MKVFFNIDYRTSWGESLYVVGSNNALGNNNRAYAVKMTPVGYERWTAEVDIDIESDPYAARFSYSYFVRSENGKERDEWGKPRVMLPSDAQVYKLFDHWQDMPKDKPFYSSAFTNCIYRRDNRDQLCSFKKGKLSIQVHAPIVAADEVVAICGASEALGAWNLDKAVRLNDTEYPLWTAEINPASDLLSGLEYKFVILKKDSGELVVWEAGDNRKLEQSPQEDCAVAISGLLFNNDQKPWRGAGTAIPVFSLRSREDFGVGEFFDLIPMIDWAESTKQSVIQILPINDTTMGGSWTDSYPYNANSTFALHPQYLRVKAMGTLDDAERRLYYDRLAEELNSLAEIDYERVNNAKNAYTHELFMQDGARIMATDDFKLFVDVNKDWLAPYAAFCVLRDRYHTADFKQWGEYANYDPQKVDAFANRNTSYINYVYYIQYFLDLQMRHVHDYAKAHGVAIKGDIPIGISRDSVDAWIHPELFNMDSQAGAPPDDFSVLGQNWGFPTYNWEVMAKDGFAWWKARFRKMSEYFDAYRIDHVLGFFRIWEIPMDQIHGLLGYFNPALPYTAEEMQHTYDFWIDVDKQTVPYIKEEFLGEFFGEYADDARRNFLEETKEGIIQIKEKYNTQRKVANYFAELEDDERNKQICKGLMLLIDDVLFIKDPRHVGKYHPRISAQQTYIYKSLSDYERWCFDRLYNDFFYHRNNDFWYRGAMWKLPPLIDATDMLVCAEDLGMIPSCVPAVMDALQILTLEIQRMPKDANNAFGDTWHYPYYSVCTTSTHDMSGIRGWWEENQENTQKFYNYTLRMGGKAPFYAEPWICEKILELHLKSPSMLCIIPLQDWLSMDGAIRRQNPHEERINVPADSRHYWRYRMHLTIDDLKEAEAFNHQLATMISNCGRN